MPFTPFLGLSALVHMGIIGWNKLFKREPHVNLHPGAKAPLYILAASCLIMLVIFTVVGVSAVLLLRDSINDPDSSVAVAEKVANETESYVKTQNVLPNINPEFARNLILPPVAYVATTLMRDELDRF